MNIKENKNKKIEYDNYIIGEIDILENDLNQYIRVISSFEEYKRNYKLKDIENYYKFYNENEIKENCIIEINNFSHFCISLIVKMIKFIFLKIIK